MMPEIGLGLMMLRRPGGAVLAAPPALPVVPQARWHPGFSAVTESGGRVVSASDLMGLAGLTEGGAGIGPRALTDALGRKFWRFEGAQYLNVATTLSSNWRNMSVFMVLRHHRGATNYFGIGNVAAGTAVNTQGSVLDVSTSGSLAPLLRSFSGGAQLDPPNAAKLVVGSQVQVVGVASRTTALGGRRLYLNAATATLTQAGTASGPILGAEIGRYPFSPGVAGAWGQFDLYEMVVFDTGLTNAQGDAVATALTAQYAIPEITNQLVLEGDSITQGTGLVTGALNGAMVLTTPGASRVPAGWRVVNVGGSGATAASITARRDAANSWTSMPLAGQNVMAFEIGRNDFPTLTETQHYANVLAYLNTVTTGILQRGWTVRVMANIAPAAALMPKTAAYRALIRSPQFLSDTQSGPGGAFDGKVSIVSTDLIAHLGQTIFEDTADAANTTYYAGDATHPTILGAELRVTGGDTPQHGVAAGL